MAGTFVVQTICEPEVVIDAVCTFAITSADDVVFAPLTKPVQPLIVPSDANNANSRSTLTKEVHGGKGLVARPQYFNNPTDAIPILPCPRFPVPGLGWSKRGMMNTTNVTPVAPYIVLYVLKVLVLVRA